MSSLNGFDNMLLLVPLRGTNHQWSSFLVFDEISLIWHVCYGLERLLLVEYLSLRRLSLRWLPVRSISGTTLRSPGRPTVLSRRGTAVGRLSGSMKRDPRCFCSRASIRLVLMSTSAEPHLHGNQCSLTSLRKTTNRLFNTSQQVLGFWKLV